MDKERLKELLQAYVDDRLSSEEISELEHALFESWTDTNKIYGDRNPTIEGRARIKRIIRKLPRTKKRIHIWQIAASILLPLFVLGAWLLTHHAQEKPHAIVSTYAEDARDIALPDGTLIHLFSGSKISYAEEFETNREVYLEGEAFLDVAKDKGNPFVVHSGPIRTEVLGTAFEVRNHDQQPMVRVHRGKVLVTTATHRRILGANEQVRYEEGGGLLYTAIKSSLPIFDFHLVNEPLESVAAILSNRFDVDIQIQSTDVSTERITTTFATNDSLYTLLDIIALVSGMEWARENNTIILTKQNK